MAENEIAFQNVESELDKNRRKYYGYLIGAKNTQYSSERI